MSQTMLYLAARYKWTDEMYFEPKTRDGSGQVFMTTFFDEEECIAHEFPCS